MSIYNVLSFEIPIIAYSVLHQNKKTVTAKEYAKSLNGLRTELKKESERIKFAWRGHISDLTAKSVQTTSGNLSHFLSTPIQTDTGEINEIMKDQIIQITEQLLPNILYGLAGGYDARYLIETKQSEMQKSRMTEGRSFMQKTGFKMGKNNASIFESLYVVQGGSNLDILENMMRNGIGIYNSAHEKKVNEFETMNCSLYNLLFSDGTFNSPFDRFELQVNFVKGKESYDLFHKELGESIKYFRTEIHHLNVSVWQRKLGLGIGEEYTLRILTKDRFTLRAAVAVTQKFTKDKHLVAKAIRAGTWLTKEII
ncbi:MAG: hypothetical protein ABSD46_04245 [Bacteroidota bacterium]